MILDSLIDPLKRLFTLKTYTWFRTRESGQNMGQRLVIIDNADLVYTPCMGRASFTSLYCTCTKENSMQDFCNLFIVILILLYGIACHYAPVWNADCFTFAMRSGVWFMVVCFVRFLSDLVIANFLKMSSAEYCCFGSTEALFVNE